MYTVSSEKDGDVYGGGLGLLKLALGLGLDRTGGREEEQARQSSDLAMSLSAGNLSAVS